MRNVNKKECFDNFLVMCVMKYVKGALLGLRGCSYGGELARLGGLARLGEISPSLKNSYKYIMGSYKK